MSTGAGDERGSVHRGDQGAPDDTALRLVYADWLEEQGDARGELIRFEVATRGLPAWDDAVWNYRPRRREVRAEAAPEWLEQLGYCSYRPLFNRPLPEPREHRWRLLQTFIETWYGNVLTAEDGDTEDQISAAEDYVASALPTAMREFYQQVGRRLQYWSYRGTTWPVQRLSIPYTRLPGIEFRVDHEWGGMWYVPINSKAADPPVRSVVTYDEEEEVGTFSEFTLLTLLYEALRSDVVRRSGPRRVGRFGRWSQVAPLVAAQAGLSHCHLPSNYGPANYAPGTIGLIEGNDVLLAYTTDDAFVDWATRTEAAYQGLCATLGEPLPELDPADEADEEPQDAG